MKRFLTIEEKDYIKEHYLTKEIKDIARELKRSPAAIRTNMQGLGLVLPPELIAERKARYQFKRGVKPHNKGVSQTKWMSAKGVEKSSKTRFKKGRLPENYKTGEHLNKDGYIVVSLGEGKTELKHRIRWEEINGKLPKNHCLRSIDKNIKNTDPNNWKLIHRSENMLLNSPQNYPKEIIPSMALISRINNKIKTIENGKK